MSKILNVGIDISLNTAACSLLPQEGRYLGKPTEIENMPSGFDQLYARISSAIQSENFTTVLIGLEASSMYGVHLMDYFLTHPFSEGVVTRVYQINAKYIHRFKKAFPEREKTDLVDAQIIAEYLRFGKLPVEYNPTALYLPLRRLVRYRYHLVKAIEREKKIFMAHLFLKFPGWVQDRPLKVLGKTALDVLSEFSLDTLAEMPLEELALFVAKAGKNRSPDPEAIAEEIQKAARESYRIRPELASSVTFILATIRRTLGAFQESLREMNKAIADQTKGFINPLLSVKGIGPVYASGILASVGDIRRFSSHDKLARMAGLTWKRNQTGMFEAEQTRMVRECDKYLRYYLIEAANSLRMHNELYQAYYQKKYQEASHHKHKRALVLTARKLVRLVFALLSKNQLCDPLRENHAPKSCAQNCQ